jgi:hypothetical protein
MSQSSSNCTTSCKEVVLFNSDSLFKIASYLPAVDLLSMLLTCKRFSSSDNGGSLSLIEEIARRVVHELATKEERPGEGWLGHYHHYLLSSLTFDQLVGEVRHVVGNNKTCVASSDNPGYWSTAFSNNIMKTGKHYVTFIGAYSTYLAGVMRPGKALQEAEGSALRGSFFQHFNQSTNHDTNNNIQCCIYHSSGGNCLSSDWRGEKGNCSVETWDGMEAVEGYDKLGMLLDLDEGTLSVYRNGRKLGVMKRGLDGPYCWVVSMICGATITMTRGLV